MCIIVQPVLCFKKIFMISYYVYIIPLLINYEIKKRPIGLLF